MSVSYLGGIVYRLINLFKYYGSILSEVLHVLACSSAPVAKFAWEQEECRNSSRDYRTCMAQAIKKQDSSQGSIQVVPFDSYLRNGG